LTQKNGGRGGENGNRPGPLKNFGKKNHCRGKGKKGTPTKRETKHKRNGMACGGVSQEGSVGAFKSTLSLSKGRNNNGLDRRWGNSAIPGIPKKEDGGVSGTGCGGLDDQEEERHFQEPLESTSRDR